MAEKPINIILPHFAQTNISTYGAVAHSFVDDQSQVVRTPANDERQGYEAGDQL